MELRLQDLSDSDSPPSAELGLLLPGSRPPPKWASSSAVLFNRPFASLISHLRDSTSTRVAGPLSFRHPSTKSSSDTRPVFPASRILNSFQAWCGLCCFEPRLHFGLGQLVLDLCW
ncbi:unnamed protein product [Prorocentrum cordatum]|uniref:Uncharacterized protein n=1 Tax=Prorocentrum cordatum TaxID=2364126 RepID=A0ABN9SC12_9DINO|nr:unnamed protein product [Polarella glacialis]